MSFGVGKVGASLVGPGLVIGPGAPTVLVEGSVCSVLADKVLPHGEPPHTSAVIVSNVSSSVLAMGKPISRDGSIATCVHPLKLGAFTVKNLI